MTTRYHISEEAVEAVARAMHLAICHGAAVFDAMGPAGQKAYLRAARAVLFSSPPVSELVEVAQMVDAWGHGLRHETAHESKMVKAARAALAPFTAAKTGEPA